MKPAELDIEFFLNLAWNPHSWNGTNTYECLEEQLARDFGPQRGTPELTSILAEYYRLNFQRKPEHLASTGGEIFSSTSNGDEAGQRLQSWRALVARAAVLAQRLPPERQDAYFELIGYPNNM